MRISDNNRIIETMSQDLQSINKQNLKNVQYKISRDYPKMKLRGIQGKVS
jgi:hypothetical protein